MQGVLRGRTVPTAGLCALLCALCATLLLPAAGEAKPPTRYSLAKDCVSLRSVSAQKLVAKDGTAYAATAGKGGAEVFRMQPTDLGIYLLYGKSKDFLGGGSGSAAEVASEPSPDTEWRVVSAGKGVFMLRSLSGDKVLSAARRLRRR